VNQQLKSPRFRLGMQVKWQSRSRGERRGTIYWSDWRKGEAYLKISSDGTHSVWVRAAICEPA